MRDDRVRYLVSQKLRHVQTLLREFRAYIDHIARLQRCRRDTATSNKGTEAREVAPVPARDNTQARGSGQAVEGFSLGQELIDLQICGIERLPARKDDVRPREPERAVTGRDG